MKSLLSILLGWALVSLHAYCGVSVSAIYQVDPNAAEGSNFSYQAITVQPDFPLQWESNGDGSSTFTDLSMGYVVQTQSGGQWEGRFDVAEVLVNGNVIQNVHRFLANIYLAQLP